MWLESRLPDFQTDWMLIVMYCDFDRKDWHVMTHHEMNPPSRNQESKAALIGMTFVLVFLGEREKENLDMTVSKNMLTAAKGLSQNGGPQNLTLDFPMKKAISWECSMWVGDKPRDGHGMPRLYRSKPSQSFLPSCSRESAPAMWFQKTAVKTYEQNARITFCNMGFQVL